MRNRNMPRKHENVSICVVKTAIPGNRKRVGGNAQSKGGANETWRFKCVVKYVSFPEHVVCVVKTAIAHSFSEHVFGTFRLTWPFFVSGGTFSCQFV